MKKYVKPTIEFIEIRPEERLAKCKYVNKNRGHACPQNRAS